MTIDKDISVRLNNRVLLSLLGNESVLLNLDTNQYFNLNLSGTIMLNHLIEGKTIDQAICSLSNEFNTTPGMIEHDLFALITELFQQGIIERIGPE